MKMQITNIRELDARLIMLEQKAAEERVVLKACVQSIKESVAPVNMFKMAVQQSSMKDIPLGNLVKTGVALAGDALGNKFFGNEKFAQIKNIAMPFLQIVNSKFAMPKEETEN